MGLSVPPKLPAYTLRGLETSVTFDGLAVAPVLPNPRAAVSVARLYTQWERKLFHWPYLMTIGGALPPVSALVEHIMAPNNSVHPALSLALQNATKLAIRGNIVFKELPLDFSNGATSILCDFKTSETANNDMLVINVDSEGQLNVAQSRREWWFVGPLFFAMDMITGAILAASALLGLFWGDLWALILFSIYFAHWLVSAFVSRCTMIGPNPDSLRIKEDPTTRFAIHERKFGGTIVFKGRQDSIERWARRTWQFQDKPHHFLLHWLWVLTGTAAAIFSTAALVNMRAPLQLIFLGLLLVSSALELGLSRLGQNCIMACQHTPHHLIQACRTRTEAIIQSWLDPEPKCRLDGLDWVELGLLPNFEVFKEMHKMLASINAMRLAPDTAELDSIVGRFRQSQSGPLAERIAEETRRSAIKALKLKPLVSGAVNSATQEKLVAVRSRPT